MIGTGNGKRDAPYATLMLKMRCLPKVLWAYFHPRGVIGVNVYVVDGGLRIYGSERCVFLNPTVIGSGEACQISGKEA